MKWAIISASGGKTAQQRWDSVHTYFQTKFGLPKGKTLRYADPLPHPTNGTIAIPVTPDAEKWVASAPIAITLVTTDDLAAAGWFQDSSPPRLAKVISLDEVATVAGARNWKRYAYAASGAAVATGALAAAHYLLHWF